MISIHTCNYGPHASLTLKEGDRELQLSMDKGHDVLTSLREHSRELRRRALRLMSRADFIERALDQQSEAAHA